MPETYTALCGSYSSVTLGGAGAGRGTAVRLVGGRSSKADLGALGPSGGRDVEQKGERSTFSHVVCPERRRRLSSCNQ